MTLNFHSTASTMITSHAVRHDNRSALYYLCGWNEIGFGKNGGVLGGRDAWY